MPIAMPGMATPTAAMVTAIAMAVVATIVVTDSDVHGGAIPAAAPVAIVVISGRVRVVVVVRIAGVVPARVTIADVGVAGIDTTGEREDRYTDEDPQEWAHGELRLLLVDSLARRSLTPRERRMNAREIVHSRAIIHDRGTAGLPARPIPQAVNTRTGIPALLFMRAPHH